MEKAIKIPSEERHENLIGLVRGDNLDVGNDRGRREIVDYLLDDKYFKRIGTMEMVPGPKHPEMLYRNYIATREMLTDCVLEPVGHNRLGTPSIEEKNFYEEHLVRQPAEAVA
jgi:hypothetical protein